MKKGLEHHFVALVKERLAALETNAFAVEKAAGLPPDAIRNVIRSTTKAGPTLSRVDQICTALGLEIYIGAKREVQELPILRGKKKIPSTVVAEPDQSMPGSGDLIVDGVQYERLSRFEVDASAGPGAIRSVDQTVDSILVTSSWLNKLGVSGDLAGLVNVRGDSMVPTIPDHSRVLIDFADRELRRDGDIFAVTLDNDFLLKRLSRFEVEGKAGYVMTSDNPSYPPRSVSAETHNYFRIVGRVRAIISEVDT